MPNTGYAIAVNFNGRQRFPITALLHSPAHCSPATTARNGTKKGAIGEAEGPIDEVYETNHEDDTNSLARWTGGKHLKCEEQKHTLDCVPRKIQSHQEHKHTGQKTHGRARSRRHNGPTCFAQRSAEHVRHRQRSEGLGIEFLHSVRASLTGVRIPVLHVRCGASNARWWRHGTRQTSVWKRARRSLDVLAQQHLVGQVLSIRRKQWRR